MTSGEDRRILGVDPSLNRTGWAVLEPSLGTRASHVATGVIAPSAGNRAERLLEIKVQMGEILDQHRPSGAYFEAPGGWLRRGGTRRETLEAMGMARGVMLASCAEANISPVEVYFSAVRSALLGRANPRVQDMIDFICSHGLTLPRRPRGGCDIDIVNAMLMALYGLYSGELVR